MTSKLVVNEIAADTGISTITVGDNMSGVTFKTGTSNLHNVGIEIAGINVLGADTPIGAGATIYNSGDVLVGGAVTATAFSGSGASLTGLTAGQIPNLSGAKITSGTIDTARLGSGTANNSVFLRGDSTWAAVTQTTINNNANNRIITGSGTANTLEGESNFTYDGNEVAIYAQTDDTDCILHLVGKTPNGGVGQAGRTAIIAESTATNNGSSSMHLRTRNSSNSQLIAMTLDSNQRVGIGTQLPSDALTVYKTNSGNPIGITIRNTNTSNYSHGRLRIESQNGAKYTDIWTDVPNDSCRIGYNSSASLMINNGNAYSKTAVSNWHNDYRVFQSGQASLSGKNPQDGSPLYLSNNAYYDATDNRWEFISSDDASQIMMENGSIFFKNGGTGSANGAITWSTNARFTQSGHLRMGSGKGIDFGDTSDASGMTSEVFDDYEEGQWTPNPSGVGTIKVTSITYSGKYTKVGRLVTVEFYANNSAGDIYIPSYKQFSGLPFATASGSYGTGRIMTEDGEQLDRQGDIIIGGSNFLINKCGSSSGTVRLSGTCTYIAS